MEITVYASKADEVQKRLDRLAKKAARYGVAFRYERSEEHPADYAVREVDYITQTIHTVKVVQVAAITFEVFADGLICANGWQVIAKIEHGDAGNIVTPFTDATDNAWYSAEPKCDHCNSNRFRAVTFIVEKDGIRKQVGRTCLKDYTGIDPATCAMWAEIRDYVVGEDDMAGYESEFGGKGIARMYPVTQVIGLAIDCIRQYGYCKRDTHNCTKDMVIDRLLHDEAPTAEDRAKAQEIVAWLVARGEQARADELKTNKLYLEAYETVEDEYGYRECRVRSKEKEDEYLAHVRGWDRVTDLQKNCAVMAKSGYAKLSHVGRLAYAPVDYDKYMERKAKEELKEKERNAAAQASNYVGNVGDKVEVFADAVQLVTTIEHQYGMTFLYKWTDESGNVFAWFASSAQGLNLKKNGVRIRGTVKDHTEYQGVKQTILTRCRWWC